MMVLVAGSEGSMGKRRINCLKQLGITDIIEYDIKKHPNMDINDLIRLKPDAMIISTPPLTKQSLIDLATQNNIPCFCEIDMMVYQGQYYQSNTFKFNETVKLIKQIIDNGEFGKPHAFQYHCGQHISDWRNFDEGFFALSKATGGCKEIFIIDIPWLEWLFGGINDITGFAKKTLVDGNIEADDVYSLSVDVGGISGSILLDLVSRPAVRELTVVFENITNKWHIPVNEKMYLEETRFFLDNPRYAVACDTYKKANFYQMLNQFDNKKTEYPFDWR